MNDAYDRMTQKDNVSDSFLLVFDSFSWRGTFCYPIVNRMMPMLIYGELFEV